MEQERRKYMSTLYSIVHHEMIGPLNNNVALADQLMRVTSDDNMKRIAQMILSCSKSVIMHANDLMDMQFLQKKSF